MNKTSFADVHQKLGMPVSLACGRPQATRYNLALPPHGHDH
jgi:hypothetical protein